MNFNITFLIKLILIESYLICDCVNAAAAAGAGAMSIFSSNYLRRSQANSNQNQNQNSFYKQSIGQSDENKKTNNRINLINRSSNSNLPPNNNYNFNKNCPKECLCQGLAIDCSNRGLKYVPKNIPTNLIKV